MLYAAFTLFPPCLVNAAEGELVISCLFPTDIGSITPPVRRTISSFSTYSTLSPLPQSSSPAILKASGSFEFRNFRPLRAVVVVGSATIIHSWAYHQFNNIWWNHPQTHFHLYRGWKQNQGLYDFGFHDSLWLHMDKFGHFYCARQLAFLMTETFNWIGLSNGCSSWLGAASSWLFMLEIELFDARFQEWGFSLGDLTANTAGVLLPVLKAHSPFLQKFTLKMSYHPTKQGIKNDYFIDDYAGMTFWLCANPRPLLPRFLRNWWPAFLNLSAGYGISEKTDGKIELYFGLDYDLLKLKTKQPALNKLIEFINYFHLPAPALRIQPSLLFQPFNF
ncbi:MAG: DUF2279 domain-containing protein [Calditrichaeota bacterium]|nr:MAG: DUF2279 domain-containing protein [Calditrichota bacterium]